MRHHHAENTLKKGLILLLSLAMLLTLLPGRALTASAQAAEPALRISYYNLSYSSETFVMYAVGYENLDPNTTEVQMLFWDNGRSDGYLLGTEDRAVPQTSKATINGESYLVFYSKGFAPKELTDTIYCRACATVGGTTYYSDPVKYSPIKYITDLLKRDNLAEADRNLAEALRAYGNAAQIRFNYHTERLAGDSFYNLTLNNAHLDDGFSYGLYPAGAALTLTADIPDGCQLEKWTDEAGNALGTGETLTLTLQKDITVTAEYGTPPDFSTDTGRTFSAASTEMIPYFFTGTPLTIEATVHLPTNYANRGGVIVGNYNYGGKQTVNLEVYTKGKPRLFLENGKGNSWSIWFETDIRSAGPRRIAFTIGDQNGECKLYLDGQLAETKPMPCAMPVIRDTLLLGSDYRSGNAQYFKGRIYALSIYEGIRTAAEIERDAVFGAELDDETLAVSYRFQTAAVRTDDGPYDKDLTSERSGLAPQSMADRYSLIKTFDSVPMTYEALIETSADVSNLKGCTILGNYNDVYTPGISFRVYLDGRPSLCLRYDEEHQDQFTFPKSILGEGRVHIAITIDDTYVYGYLNGTQVLKKAHCGYFPDLVPYPFSVGGDNRPDCSWWFRDGTIYSLQVYSGYRTAEQIREDINRIDVNDPTLMASYDFEQSQEDRSQNGNHVMPYFYEKPFLSPDSYDYTFACVGDTQSVVKLYPDQLHILYDFILDHVDDMKIARVIGLGDITEDNTADQWELASQQIFRMDGVVPYTVVRGNHDLVARTEEAEPTRTLMFGYYFDNDTYRSQFDGSYEGGVENVYKRFTVCGIPYLILCLDYGPDDDVLAWANDVCDQFPEDNVIISTHAFLFHDGTTLDAHDICPPSHGVGFNDCDVMWDRFVSLHENIVLVVCGHDPSEDIVVTKMTGVHGNAVTCCLINPQYTDFYQQASGLIALLHFSNGGRTITIENYSTIQRKFYKTDNEIVIENVARVS